MPVQLNNIYHFTKNVFFRFINDGCTYRASALTYTTLLALVPLMLMMVLVLAAFPDFSSWGQTIQDFIFSNFIPATGDVIQSYIGGVIKQAGQLSAVGLVFLLITAVLMLFNIEQAFNVIWRVDKKRNGLSAFLLYWALLTLSPILMGLSLVISSYVISMSVIAGAVAKYGLIKIALPILPFILAVIAFTILYVAIPNCRVPLRYGFLSAVFTAALFEIAKSLFTLYLMSSRTYQVLYGALATVPIFLLWIYISWTIILFGAVMCHALTYRLSYYSQNKLDGFTHAYLWLGYLWVAQRQQKSLTLAQLVKKDHCGYEVDPEQQIHILIEHKLIRRTASGRFMLGVELHDINFWHLVHILPWKFPTQITTHKKHPWLTQLREVVAKIDEYKKEHNLMLAKLFETQVK